MFLLYSLYCHGRVYIIVAKSTLSIYGRHLYLREAVRSKPQTNVPGMIVASIIIQHRRRGRPSAPADPLIHEARQALLHEVPIPAPARYPATVADT